VALVAKKISCEVAGVAQMDNCDLQQLATEQTETATATSDYFLLTSATLSDSHRNQ